MKQITPVTGRIERSQDDRGVMSPLRLLQGPDAAAEHNRPRTVTTPYIEIEISRFMSPGRITGSSLQPNAAVSGWTVDGPTAEAPSSAGPDS